MRCANHPLLLGDLRCGHALLCPVGYTRVWLAQEAVAYVPGRQESK